MYINNDFSKWWDENEKQFMSDACHMSEFHMASVVWEAAIQHEREACAKVCEDDESGRDGGGYFAGIIRERSNAQAKGQP